MKNENKNSTNTLNEKRAFENMMKKNVSDNNKLSLKDLSTLPKSKVKVVASKTPAKNPSHISEQVKDVLLDLMKGTKPS